MAEFRRVSKQSRPSYRADQASLKLNNNNRSEASGWDEDDFSYHHTEPKCKSSEFLSVRTDGDLRENERFVAEITSIVPMEAPKSSSFKVSTYNPYDVLSQEGDDDDDESVVVKKLKEEVKKMKEKVKEMEEEVKKKDKQIKKMEEEAKTTEEEHVKMLDDQAKKMDEKAKKMEEMAKNMDKQAKMMEEKVTKMEEMAKKIEEQVKRIEEKMKEGHVGAPIDPAQGHWGCSIL